VDQAFSLRAKGSAEQPIILRAETPGQVKLTGSSRLSLSGSHLHVEDLLFKDGSLSEGAVISFRDDRGNHAQHCVLRNTAIINYNPPKQETRYMWVSLYGERHRVEHCTFSGQKHSGVTLCVWLREGKSAAHVIRRNLFTQRPPGHANGYELIRIGTSATSHLSASCQVTENWFESCEGEIEIISNKSCDNQYLRNVFFRCSGTLTLRHGDRCLVKENLFHGEHKAGSGGVRVMGRDHHILRNRFEQLRGRDGGIIALHAGIPNSPANGYVQVKNCRISENLFLNNSGPHIYLSSGLNRKAATLKPEQVHIAGNHFHRDEALTKLWVEPLPLSTLFLEQNHRLRKPPPEAKLKELRQQLGHGPAWMHPR